MKIIDSHLHLDDKISRNIADVVKSLNQDLEKSQISRGLILHLLVQKWSYQELGEQVLKYPRLKAFQNVDPFSSRKYQDLEDGVKNFGYIGLKLHSRLQNFRMSDPRVIELCEFAGKLNIPVLLDAFPDGNAIMDGFSVVDFANLATKCKDTRFIWAHFGGHYVLDFLMVAKRLPNVFLDISYSWLYYQGSSVPQNIAYALKSMRYKKVFYGSDYPDRSIAQSLEMSLKSFESFNIQGNDLENVLFNNAQEFFGWSDL